MDYGALKDQPDSRDYLFAETRIAKAARAITLPGYADWAMYAGPIKNQSGLGTCVAQACASGREFLVRSLDNNATVVYSPLYLYYRAREIMGTLPQDSGVYTRDAMKALGQWGIPEEVAWPYAVPKYNDVPSADVDVAARWKRIYSYHRIDIFTVEQMKQSLAEGHPFVLSMEIFGGLIGPKLTNGNVWGLPQDGTPSLGGHAILVVGYYDDAQMFHCQNSWGKDWGQHGFFWLPYEYVSRYGWDAWVMVA